MYRTKFTGWGKEGQDIGHLDGMYVQDFYPHFDRDANYLTEDDAYESLRDYKGPDIDGIEPGVEVVACD